jgi:nitrate reductase gamma subunit
VTSIETGIRLAFSNAITGMFSTSLWIILIGFVMSLFIPVISLQREMPKAAAKAASAESLQG